MTSQKPLGERAKAFLSALKRRIAASLNPKHPTPRAMSRMNLHPEVYAAFHRAFAPVVRRETPSVMGSTSRGRSWYPRNRAYQPRVVGLRKDQRLPKTSPFLLAVITATSRVYLQRHRTLERADRLAAA